MDLIKLCQCLLNSRYDPKLFPGLIWQHRVIGGHCLLFANGVINCNGRASSFEDGRQRLRRYAQGLQNLRCQVHLKVKIITASASHTLSGALGLYRSNRDRTLLYELKLFPAVNFKCRESIFVVFIREKWSSRVSGVRLKSMAWSIRR